jgi:hypothetical protein
VAHRDPDKGRRDHRSRIYLPVRPGRFEGRARSDSDLEFGAGVTVQSVASIREKLPAASDYHLVPNAGHWAFLAPCTQGQTKSNPRVCVDADGFDRTAFHREFNAAVLKIFNEYLSDAKKP